MLAVWPISLLHETMEQVGSLTHTEWLSRLPSLSCVQAPQPLPGVTSINPLKASPPPTATPRAIISMVDPRPPGPSGPPWACQPLPLGMGLLPGGCLLPPATARRQATGRRWGACPRRPTPCSDDSPALPGLSCLFSWKLVQAWCVLLCELAGSRQLVCSDCARATVWRLE